VKFLFGLFKTGDVTIIVMYTEVSWFFLVLDDEQEKENLYLEVYRIRRNATTSQRQLPAIPVSWAKKIRCYMFHVDDT
jgi:hypothetical protein